MPFGLINAGATFQRMMDEIFKNQLGRNLEVYIDDMIKKSKISSSHSLDLRETFENVRRNNMRLNPLKCSFGLTFGKFLGFLVSQRGIEADPSQIKVISEMKDPSTIKEVQRLTGCITALRRFIPQAFKKCNPFFKVIKEASKNKKLMWDDQSEYEALLAGIRLAVELEVKVLEIFGDSQLVAKQLQGEFKAHDVQMLTYLNLAMSLLGKVLSWTIKNIYREDNQWTNTLSKLASSVVATSEAIYVEERSAPSIDMDTPSIDMLKETLSELKIKHIKSSVAYPQANGQVEVSNRIILQGLKKRVDELPRPWVDELPNVLWSYKTTPMSAQDISPFKMAFGLEAVSPVEVSLNSPRVEYFDHEASREGIQLHNVLMEEVRDEASMRVLQQQARTTAYFNKKVKVK
ncbi:uncharacterized protein LOC141685386 [Apium graveolens]|uniref:uncharacterized protein LOC141685386 n=1 Tax=Apium graveolens TaxID=4045 RepID=UPI003D79858D